MPHLICLTGPAGIHAAPLRAHVIGCVNAFLSAFHSAQLLTNSPLDVQQKHSQFSQKNNLSFSPRRAYEDKLFLKHEWILYWINASLHYIYFNPIVWFCTFGAPLQLRLSSPSRTGMPGSLDPRCT